MNPTSIQEDTTVQSLALLRVKDLALHVERQPGHFHRPPLWP